MRVVRAMRAPVVVRRRRGDELEAAIRDAAFEELCEVGFSGMSMENIAARAQTGKASVYRRWSTKHDLIRDVIDHRLAMPDCGFLTGVDDSITTEQALRAAAADIIATVNSPLGDAIRVLKCEAAVDADLGEVIDERFNKPRSEALLALLKRGVLRGEVRPGAATRTVADVIPAMITYRLVLQRRPLRGADLNKIIDEVFLPLITVRSGPESCS